MTNIFQKLDQIVPELPGWGGAEKSKTLAAMVIALRPQISVEIGIYGGRTFFGLALAHAHIGVGSAWAIDPWSNQAASEGYEGGNLEFWQRVPLQKLFTDFEHKVFELSVKNVTVIHRKKSDDVEPPDNIGILHVDGQHTEQAVRDVNRFASKVHVGGIVVMDDTTWQNGSDAPVARAVLALQGMGFLELYKLGTGAVFQRMR